MSILPFLINGGDTISTLNSVFLILTFPSNSWPLSHLANAILKPKEGE